MICSTALYFSSQMCEILAHYWRRIASSWFVCLKQFPVLDDHCNAAFGLPSYVARLSFVPRVCCVKTAEATVTRFLLSRCLVTLYGKFDDKIQQEYLERGGQNVKLLVVKFSSDISRKQCGIWLRSQLITDSNTYIRFRRMLLQAYIIRSNQW